MILSPLLCFVLDVILTKAVRLMTKLHVMSSEEVGAGISRR